MRFSDIKETLLELIFPNCCMVCGEVLEFHKEKWLCPKCRLETISGKTCDICGVPIIANNICSDCQNKKLYFKRAYCAYEYKDKVRKAIHNIKFNNEPRNVEYFARPLYDYAKSHGFSGADIVVPVPMHKKKLKQRGYNQSAMLASFLANLGMGEYREALVKIRDTQNQHDLSEKERLKNLKDAFTVTGDVKDKKILLVDDIYTTGSTVNECAKTLIKAGAESVEVICIAIVNRRE
ncbi:MAG: ComF family protein [Firmicutes bacterium]|nr:ComF family protein [Bacillota bacterium]